VELVEFVTPHDGFAALRAEKLDVATFGTGLPLVHIANGADFMIIGGVAGGDVYLITSLEKKDSIKSLADLRGKKSLPCGSARGIWCSAGLSGRPGFPGKTTCGFSS
jgi:ABC-type nitrate/sulfonate/bicarbonate transport system substrate-binding protein